MFARGQNTIQIFSELMFHLKHIAVHNQTVNMGRAIRALPEVHEVGVASGAFNRRDFARVDIDLWQSKEDRSVWYRVRFNKSDRPLVFKLFARFHSGNRKQLLHPEYPTPGNEYPHGHL